MKKIFSIIGARPQFVKAAAVSRAIAQSSVLSETIIHTGQHFDIEMSEVFFIEMGIPEPACNLGISGGSHGVMTGRMLIELEKVLQEGNPDCILIYGDTNSTLAGALAGSKLQIPVAHVEAGLRSYNRSMPEEINRIIADRISSILFVPSEKAAENLHAEGIGSGLPDVTPGHGAFAEKPEIVITGDVMVDTIRLFRGKASSKADFCEKLDIKPNSYLVMTVHRQENTDNIENLKSILEAVSMLSKIAPVVFPIHPRTRKVIKDNNLSLPSGVIVQNPLSYLEMLSLMDGSLCILTDSGGMQKEALILGKPCVTLRNETEWTETVDSGWNIVAGVKPQRIMDAVHALKIRQSGNEKPPTDLYGDGHASERIVLALEKRLGR